MDYYCYRAGRGLKGDNTGIFISNHHNVALCLYTPGTHFVAGHGPSIDDPHVLWSLFLTYVPSKTGATFVNLNFESYEISPMEYLKFGVPRLLNDFFQQPIWRKAFAAF